jgi:hypothetical protein
LSAQSAAGTASDLGAFVKQAERAERYRASVALAERLSKLGPPCKVSADWKSAFFLAEAAGATVLLEVSRAEAGFAESVADAIIVWLANGATEQGDEADKAKRIGALQPIPRVRRTL